MAADAKLNSSKCTSKCFLLGRRTIWGTSTQEVKGGGRLHFTQTSNVPTSVDCDKPCTQSGILRMSVWKNYTGWALGTPINHAGVSELSSKLRFPFQLHGKCAPWEAADDGSRNWVPEAHMGDLASDVHKKELQKCSWTHRDAGKRKQKRKSKERKQKTIKWDLGPNSPIITLTVHGLNASIKRKELVERF